MIETMARTPRVPFGAGGAAMFSQMRDLWPYLCRATLISAVLTGWLLVVPLVFSLLFGSSLSQFSLVVAASWLCLTLSLLLVFAWRDRWLWTFLARTRRFLTASDGRVVLRFAPELQGQIDPSEVLRLAGTTLAGLEATLGRLGLIWYGRGLALCGFRRRVHVYLFSTSLPITEVFGPLAGGMALPPLHAVLIPFEGGFLEEWLRHEVTHLFGCRWNPWAPPLLAEGLANWQEGNWWGFPIDATAAQL